MDQTRGVDRESPLGNQLMDFLKKRFEVPGIVLGGEDQYYKKAVMGIISIVSGYYFNHPEELKPYEED